MLSPLCAITAKASEFQWEKLHSDAFTRAKQVIANSCTLQYFNSEDPIVIQVDASSIRVGAALMQQGRVVSYHSRALTPTQQRYSNIEHECYRLVNGVEHFHHYIFGQDFVVQTDHQPLVQLTKKPRSEISPRLQYSFNTVYAKQNGVPIANCLSRNITIDTAREDESLNITIAAISPFQEGKLHQIKWEMAKDILFVKLAHVIQNGWPAQHLDSDQELSIFWIHRLNLSIVDGIIMNGTCIVIPKSLQAEYLKCLHTGHFVVSKCHAIAKSTVYWPGIDQDITNLIGSCDVCREVQHTPHTFNEHTTEACYPGHIYAWMS